MGMTEKTALNILFIFAGYCTYIWTYLNIFWTELIFSIWKSLPTTVSGKERPFQPDHQWPSSSYLVPWIPWTRFQSWRAGVWILFQSQIHHFEWTRGYPCSWWLELRLQRPKRPRQMWYPSCQWKGLWPSVWDGKYVNLMPFERLSWVWEPLFALFYLLSKILVYQISFVINLSFLPHSSIVLNPVLMKLLHSCFRQ